MYLSSVEIIGFKSFAQRVAINFDAGVTAIVGPNGCGKTNIVDAIRWALGEQRYSTLRSDKMEDVIFNGTKSRKALGLAEVSLVIENTKGILPTEYSEVTITRRVFRSGESEYLLNKVPCRLKDILDLFMDTGMGSDAYSVIELKMVETILSDKTDERRKLFEEAAGVTKYKFRRKAAVRKLESVQQDLSRVNDIVKEVQKTVSTLERQAKKAEQYNDVSVRLRTLEIDLLEREFALVAGRLAPLEAKFSAAAGEKTTIHDTLRTQEEYIDRLGAGLRDIELAMEEAQHQAAGKSEAIHRSEERLLIASERRGALLANIERYEQEKSELVGQQDELKREVETLAGRRTQIESDLAAAEATYARLKEELSVRAAEVDGGRNEVQVRQEGILKTAHDIVQQRGEQERLKTRIDNLHGRIDRLLEDNALYAADIERDNADIARLTSQDRELRRRFVEAEMQLFEREKAKREMKEKLDQLKQRPRDIVNEIEKKESKIDFLRRMIETNEGFSEGTKYLLAREESKKRKLVTVADVIEVDEQYRAAIEAALGDAASILVVESVEEGNHAVEELKRQAKGKAMFVCTQWVPRLKRPRRSARRIPYLRAAEVVRCDTKYRPLIDFLLDDAIVVDTLGAADDVFAALASVRCVSLDGEVLTSTGFLRGGSRRQDEGGLIGKKSQITELEQQVASLREDLARAEAKQAEMAAAHGALAIQPFVAVVKGIEKEMTAIEMRIAQLEFEKKRANDGIERNRTEIESLEREIRDLESLQSSAAASLTELERANEEHESQAGVAARRLEELESLLAEKTRTVSDGEIRVVTLQGDLRNNGRDAERCLARGNDVEVTLRRRDEEIAHARDEIGRLSAEITSTQQELDSLRQEYAVLESKKNEVEESYNARREELHSLELRLKDERRLYDDAVSSAHELEMKISELRSNAEHLKLRAKEEFEIDLQLKTYPEDEWVDFAQMREEVKTLKYRIRVLGAINFAAFDEFGAESDRLNFLTQQRDDLLEAEKTLLRTIEEINATAQRKFLETFGHIRENFIATFKELFLEGDECDLKLEENVDPLEATIEIIAKPRGKRPTSIDLLSGGEKTLTAIALLFAIYLVKPSPFCILDEVDAPLDDSNIDRYTRILKKFSGNTQFIVVTHNKRTMEAASALYGVTMEEEGVSKIVTVRFNEEARVRSATVTS